MIQSKDFAEKLAKKIPNGKQACKSKSGVPLFFETSTMSRMFTNLFGIKDITTFDNAFQIATGGQGDELSPTLTQKTFFNNFSGHSAS